MDMMGLYQLWLEKTSGNVALQEELLNICGDADAMGSIFLRRWEYAPRREGENG